MKELPIKEEEKGSYGSTHESCFIFFLKKISLNRIILFSSVQSFDYVQLFVTPWAAAHQATCPSPTPRVYSNSCPLCRSCHPAISYSVVPFSCLQSFPASGSFLMSWLFTSGGQSIGVSGSTSVLPVNIQNWFPLGWTGLISMQSKGLLVFSSVTVQNHQFFGAHLSL